MKEDRYNLWLIRICGLLIIPIILFGIKGISYAKYEVGIDSTEPATSSSPIQWKDKDIKVYITKPSMQSGDTLIGFAYKWTISATSLTYTIYNSGNYDGFIQATDAAKYLISLSKNIINDDDYNTLRYLHVQTVYNVNSLGDDKVIGPFNIDNVVKGVSIRLPDPDDPNKDLKETRNTTITIQIAYPSGDIATNGLYLNETKSIPSEGLPLTTTSYTLQNTDPGEKSIYAWFKDKAGNVSSPVSASFTLSGAVSIDPNSATIDLSKITTINFTIRGSEEGYTWTIIEEKDKDGNDVQSGTIAEFASSSSNVLTVTVKAKQPGSFKMKAVKGTDTLTTSKITVIQGYLKGDADGNNQIDATDALYVLHYFVGNISADQLKGDCDVNKDGKIDATDALYILHYYVGNISSFD